jgi:glutathione synthase
MYPWKALDPSYDSTLRLIHECVKRGHTVAIAAARNLIIKDNTVQAGLDIFVAQKIISDDFKVFHNTSKFKKSQLPLVDFDVIFMRDDPPLNHVALNFLDAIKEDVFIVNDINGLRIANNKLYIFSFHDKFNRFTPVTYASKNRQYLEKIFKSSQDERMILKPLMGYGGKGVVVLERRAVLDFRTYLDCYIKNNKSEYVILQEYIEGSEKGDIRILMLNGKPIGAMKRIPAEGEMRANVSLGGRVEKHQLTKSEEELCEFIGPKLVRDGLFFVGIDVINGKLIEVNVQTPGGISRINALNKVNLQIQIIDFIESVIKGRKLSFSS